jgi:multidrug efflux pump subunit AcrB
MNLHLLTVFRAVVETGSFSEAVAELHRPLGITLIGGPILAQLLTFYSAPAIYQWVDQLPDASSRFP